MPPKRKSPAAAVPAPAFSPRKTRSMAAGKWSVEAPAKKEVAVEPKGKKRAKKEEVAAVEEEVVVSPSSAEQKGRRKAKKEEVEDEKKKASPSPPAEQKGRKKAKKEEVEDEKKKSPPPPPPSKQKGRKKVKEAAVEDDGDAIAQDGKRVIVEACTQCQHFKRRALKVKEDLESIVPGVSVVINPAKPRRGCLEISEEGGEVFISLLNMPRPFTAMKKLDMDEVIKDIAKKIS